MTIWYGGDYNPEQWPREIWDEDVRLMNRAGVSLATVGVFSWARLEPREGDYDFTWLDEVLDLLHANGVRVDLATATASPPPWLALRYPQTLPVTEHGVRLSVGSRQQYCPSSPVYRQKAAELVRRIVERYADHPALELWHVNNEYGCHVSHCYCEVSAEAFRDWLRAKYGDVEELNRVWGTAFWSQRYDSFNEVSPPRAAPTFRNPTQLLDFDRFSNDELLACYRAEAAIIRDRSAIPVTTNFMGFFKAVDYWAWAREVDIVSDDTYPDPADPDAPAYAAMVRDLMRSLGGGAPWLLMEQAPSAVNWRRQNAAKAPGQMRAWSYQSVARGADGVLFFQWRQSAVGSEKFHSGLVPHAGTDTRLWREVEQLGSELAALSSLSGAEAIAGTRVPSTVAITLDWDSWWAIEQPATPTDVSYLHTLFAWHRALTESGVTVDFVRSDADLSGYSLVVAPAHFTATDAQVANLAEFAQTGTLVVGFGTAVTDENLHVRLGGYLGAPLRSALGVWIEEFAPPAAPDPQNLGTGTPPALALYGSVFGGAAAGGVWAEYLRVEDAETLATFGAGALSGWPAVTRRATPGGAGWYVATLPEPAALQRLAAEVLLDAGIELPAPVTRGGLVECVRRGGSLFVINHGADDAVLQIDGTDLLTGAPTSGMRLPQHAVAIVRPREG
ncbi:beta-galactosidase [Cryobacterium sp. SO1]|uniref:beta-galactosidase n=1 Tax=Cryobacterium sp. SO1 TaxID=1897061 RepID=UPI00102389BF|nr:beta-galactosidase [Cryobacterium sp. SO1]RZI35919.1 Beta-galactosidase bgaB [Cryobacterium sp. SO1]